MGIQGSSADRNLIEPDQRNSGNGILMLIPLDTPELESRGSKIILKAIADINVSIPVCKLGRVPRLREKI